MGLKNISRLQGLVCAGNMLDVENVHLLAINVANLEVTQLATT
jgi:hypothetical protein